MKTMTEFDYIGTGATGATFDVSNSYRYSLWRRWGDETATPDRMCAFIGLNPSTADEKIDDPTVRRCIGFAKSWGFSGMVMLNLFAFRATDPDVMKRNSFATGPDNDEALKAVVARCGMTICCWGFHGIHQNRCGVVRFALRKHDLYHLGLTKHGHPKHPLYLPANSERILWRKQP